MNSATYIELEWELKYMPKEVKSNDIIACAWLHSIAKANFIILRKFSKFYLLGRHEALGRHMQIS